MPYGEQRLDFGQQADYLLDKGLVADRDELIQRLRNIGYHRLYAYAHPYLQRSPEGEATEEFQDGASLEKIWRHYQFDRNLRRHFLDAVERIEVALRCMLSYHHTENHTPYDYASADYFPQWKGYLQKLEHLAAQKKAGDAYAKAGAESAGSLAAPCGEQHGHLPIWQALGISDFGFLCYFYRYSDKSIRQTIAQTWGLSVKVLSSWLPALRDLRNDCAHHARVWGGMCGMTYTRHARRRRPTTPPCVRLRVALRALATPRQGGVRYRDPSSPLRGYAEAGMPPRVTPRVYTRGSTKECTPRKAGCRLRRAG